MYSPSSSSEDIESESEDDNANAAEEKKYIVYTQIHSNHSLW